MKLRATVRVRTFPSPFAETSRVGPDEKEYLRTDGSRAWMLFSGARMGDGTVVEYCIDISARKHTEMALLSHVEPLSALIEDIEPDGRGVPPLLRQHLKLGARVLGFNVGTGMSRAIDCLFLVDLRHAKPSALRRYLGDDAAGHFIRTRETDASVED